MVCADDAKFDRRMIINVDDIETALTTLYKRLDPEQWYDGRMIYQTKEVQMTGIRLAGYVDDAGSLVQQCDRSPESDGRRSA